MQQNSSNETLFTSGDAAGFCKISKRCWLAHSAKGLIPAPVRIGGSVRWRKSDLDAWVKWGCPDRDEFEARMEGGAS